MKIFIIIVNFNGHKDTIECLDSLMEAEFGDLSITTLVVDNASREKFSPDIPKYARINLEIVQNPENLGFTGGNNIGIKYALDNGTDYILLLNNDTLVSKDFLKKMVEFAEDKNALISSPKIYFAKGYEFHKDRYKADETGKVIWYAGGNMDLKNVIGTHRGVDVVDMGQFELPETTDYATGCCMLIKKEVFGKIGMLDDNYFVYYEDADFSFGARKAGIESYYFPKSVIWHKNAGSTGGSGSKLQDYYISRNRLYFGMKHAAFKSKVALIHEGIRNIVSGREGQRAGALDYFLGRMGKSKRF